MFLAIRAHRNMCMECLGMDELKRNTTDRRRSFTDIHRPDSTRAK